MKKRILEENIFKFLMMVSTSVIVFFLAFILVVIVIKGLPALNLDMITKTPGGGYYLGKEGGILNAIVGSIYLTLGATFLSFIISLPVVLYLNVYLKKKSFLANFARFSLDVIWGVPSIVIGAFGFSIMLVLGLKASLLAGIITVAILIFPIMTRAIDEVIRMVPLDLYFSSYCLGTTRLETAFKVITKQCVPGILTAVLMAMGRGIGDAASVLFTAGFSDKIPTSLFQPAATLPLAIFFQLGTPYPQVQNRAYASAFVLTLIILLISVFSRLLSKKFNKNIVK